MSIPHYLVVSPIVGYSMMGGVALWTFWFVKRIKRRGAAIAAAARVP